MRVYFAVFSFFWAEHYMFLCFGHHVHACCVHVVCYFFCSHSIFLYHGVIRKLLVFAKKRNKEQLWHIVYIEERFMLLHNYICYFYINDLVVVN